MNFKTALILFSLLTLVSCGKDLRRALGADHQAEIDQTTDQQACIFQVLNGEVI